MRPSPQKESIQFCVLAIVKARGIENLEVPMAVAAVAQATRATI